MKGRAFLAVAAVFFVVFLTACGDEAQLSSQTEVQTETTIVPPSQIRLEQLCQSFMRGDYEGLIALIHGYKDKPQKFKEQLVYMFQQREMVREKGGLKITKIHPTKISVRPCATVADVYLDISYEKNVNEEIILPLLYDGGKWWIK